MTSGEKDPHQWKWTELSAETTKASLQGKGNRRVAKAPRASQKESKKGKGAKVKEVIKRATKSK